jgi:hypothetical protein
MRNLSLPFYAKLALVLFAIICLGYLAILGQSILAREKVNPAKKRKVYRITKKIKLEEPE